MGLTAAYTTSCSTARRGGVAAVRVIPQAALDTVTKTSGQSDYGTVSFASGYTGWYKIDFEEDTAEWTETVDGPKANYMVTEEVTFLMAGLSRASRDYIEDLMDDSPCGVFMLITDGNGVNWLLGYTDDFTTDRPMKLVSVEGKTGTMFNDEEVGSKLTFRATSGELAHTVTAAVVDA